MKCCYLPFLVALLGAASASAQVLIANDDSFGVAPNEPLEVDAPGVMDNDLFDDEKPDQSGGTVELVSDVATGTLALASDGSFTFSAGAGFSGLETFVYRVTVGAVSATATVTLSACRRNGVYFSCWKESAFLAKADELGFLDGFTEGFEDDAVWGSSRSPDEVPFVDSVGIRWQSNHPDPPASNLITTGPGAAYTGQWGIFDREHGYATNFNQLACAADVPPPDCLWHDGITGERRPWAPPLHGVGAWLRSADIGKIAILLDGIEIPVAATSNTGGFFGAIDTTEPGFSEFEFRELDATSEQRVLIWLDDFVMLGEIGQVPIPIPMPRPALLALAALLVAVMGWLAARRSRGS
ncbi:MAG: hypothetical protein KJO38_12540 [Gammaproteobacteria bacterium]|nr:hypothetical protein [Gammaproteobacteria bacterium]